MPNLGAKGLKGGWSSETGDRPGRQRLSLPMYSVPRDELFKDTAANSSSAGTPAFDGVEPSLRSVALVDILLPLPASTDPLCFRSGVSVTVTLT